MAGVYGWVGVRLSAEEKAALQELAASDGRTMSSLVRKWLAEARHGAQQLTGTSERDPR